MKRLKYIDIINRNRELSKSIEGEVYKISILSNVINNKLKEILEYELRSSKINAEVVFGNYDTIVQDSRIHQSSNAVIIFWELSNLINGFQFQVNTLSDIALEDIVEKVKSDFAMVCRSLQNTGLVLINKFTAFPFSSYSLQENNLEHIATSLNEHISNNRPKNFHVLDTEKIVAHLGVERSYTLREYYSSKIFYSVDFYSVYAKYTFPYFASSNGRSKKILVFDCDNTLWSGILGEDGLSGIDMSPNSTIGIVFSEIQHIALALTKRGILIGLCSKNNPEDVDEVLDTHPDMVLHDDDISIKKCNWND